MEHDHKWFAETLEEFAKGNQELKHDVCQIAEQYHEHMKAKEKEVSDKFQSLAIEQACKICDYSFKGSSPCKCHMRVSADVFQAVVDKHQLNIKE